MKFRSKFGLGLVSRAFIAATVLLLAGLFPNAWGSAADPGVEDPQMPALRPTKAEESSSLRFKKPAVPAATPWRAVENQGIGLYDMNARGVSVANDYAYVAADDGLYIIDVSNPLAPYSVGHYSAPGALDVYVAGNYAYVTNEISLRVVDVSDPAAPRQMGVYNWQEETSGFNAGVVVSGYHAYVAAGDLRVIDISDPAAPRKVGVLATRGNAEDVFLAGRYAYVADGDSGLLVFDISDPTEPRQAGTYDSPGYSVGVFVMGDHAYVADWNRGLRVVSLPHPSSPREVGAYDSPGRSRGVFVIAGYAYVADETGIRVVDVSSPRAPEEAGFARLADTWDVFVAGSYAYVADGNSGLSIIDIGDILASPQSEVYVTTRDNENNAHTGTPDNDMYPANTDCIFNDDPLAPIEFNIIVPCPLRSTSAHLSLSAEDVDEPAEQDEVHFNGHFVGRLTGADGVWSTSVFNIDPSWVRQGGNLVEVFVDVPNSGWCVRVDWGELALAGSGMASIRDAQIDRSGDCYQQGQTVGVLHEVDTTLPSQEIRVETKILDPNNVTLAIDIQTYTIQGNQDDGRLASLTLPEDIPDGTYTVQVSVLDDTCRNAVQDIWVTMLPVSHTCSAPTPTVPATATSTPTLMPTATPTPTVTPGVTPTADQCHDDYEPNDSRGEAALLTPNQIIQALICPETDRDIYALDVSTLDPFIVEMKGLEPETDFDMWLYDPDGAPLHGSTNEGNADERIEYIPSRTGHYYLMVFRPEAAPANTGPYTLNYDLAENHLPGAKMYLSLVTRN